MATTDLSSENRKKLAAKGAALKDGSFPIADDEDLENAIQAIGRAKDPAAAKAHIIRRAKALKATDKLPDDWTNDVAASAADVGDEEPAAPEVQPELYVLSAPATENFMAFGRSKSGKLFRKEILPIGRPFSHPRDPKKSITVTDEMASTMITNFENGVCDIVQVPLCDANNDHTEDPDRNIGEVIGLEISENSKGSQSLFATIDARDEKAAKKLGKTYLGGSAMMSLDYTDTSTGTKAGPTLLHVAVTNRPHVTGLDDFSEVIAASADQLHQPLLFTQTEEVQMDLEQIKKLLKDEHSIDLDELMAKPAASDEPDLSEAVLSAVQDALAEAGVIKLTNTDNDLTSDDIVGAIKELADEKVALSGRIESLETEAKTAKLSAAGKEIDDLIKAGRILPKQRDAMLKLSVASRETFEALLPDESLVELSERGQLVTEEVPNDTVDNEITRLSAQLAEMAGSKPTTNGNGR